MCNAKLFNQSSIELSIEWTKNKGFNANKISSFILFENYKFFIVPFENTNGLINKSGIILKPFFNKNKLDNQIIKAFKSQSITILEDEWFRMNAEDLVRQLTKLTDSFKTKSIAPE